MLTIAYALEQLHALAPPPSSPVATGTSSGWSDVERALGSSLPCDYKAIIDSYGAGEFGDQFALLNPFDSDISNYLGDVSSLLDTYKDGRVHSPEQCPFPVWPEPGGLLTAGADMNGGTAFWVTFGKPDEWTVVSYDWRGGYEYQHYNMNLIGLLIKWLSAVPSDKFLGLSTRNIRRDPVFCARGQQRKKR